MQDLQTGKKRLSGFTGELVERRLGEIANKITTGKLGIFSKYHKISQLIHTQSVAN